VNESIPQYDMKKEVIRMRKLLIIMMAALVLVVGCTKKDDTGTSPSPSASASAPGASAAPNASPSGGGAGGGSGAATGSPAAGATAAPQVLPSLTKEQLAKLTPTSTYDDLVKIVGKDVKPSKDESGKKTYELKVSNEANTYVNVTYFSDGKMSEINVFKK
jgi:major membrane immunogen (membrane-anchored lipoprotein)